MWFAHFIIYYILFLSFVIYYGKVKNNILRDNIYILLVFSPLIILGSLRYPVPGGDTSIYLETYNVLKEGSSIDDSMMFEYGFLLFTKFISFCGFSDQIYLFIISLIIFSSFSFFIIKYSSYVWISVFLLVGMEYFDQSMNLLRQILAISILLYSYKYLRIGSYFRFAVFVFIASFFHLTSLIFLLSVFVNKIPINNRILLFYFLLLVLFSIFSSRILFFIMNNLNIYSIYLEHDVYTIVDQPKLACILHLFIDMSILFLVFVTRGYRKEINKNIVVVNDNLLMTKLLMIASLFWALAVNFTTIGRLAYYFEIFTVILIPNTVYMIKYSNNKIFIITCILLFFTVKYFTVSYLRPDWAGLYPFRFYFDYE